MKIRPIKTEKDHKTALARIAVLMSAEAGTEKADELDVLATLVEAYERKDLEPYIGSRHRVSEVLNRKRGLSLDMLQRLHRGLNIPLEVLVGNAA
jgi:HTH-type transcriptional regulator/antitoxin HigA